jgi:hypothetical protein
MAAMEQPGPVLAVIGAAGLLVIGGAFYLGAMAAMEQEPAAPPGAVNVSPAADQPVKDEEGEPLPVQPGEPEENQPVVNAPPAGSSAAAPAQPPGDGG